MRLKIVYLAAALSLFAAGCTSDKKESSQSGSGSWISPEAGTSIYLGEKLNLNIQVNQKEIDSIVYLLDGKKISLASNLKPVSISTDSIGLGNRMITARIYKSGQPEEINTNIVLKSSLKPQRFSYQVQQTFDHDTSSYTQGLEFHDGVFYESDGEYGASSLRKVDLSGKVLKKLDLSKDIFAEGITLVGDKVVQLTWENNQGIVYDKNSFQVLSTFPYQNSRQGWGLCFDGNRLYKSDGSNLIYLLNKDNFKEEGYIEVYDQNGPVDQLNELEFIDGNIYANIYQSGRIVIINPKNGQVTAEVDLSDILPDMYKYPNTDVLNGIAWDAKGKRLFVTGKKWPKLFQIKLIPFSAKSNS